MPQSVYELVSSAARYWFLFLMVVIVFRSYRWYRKDQKEYKKQLKLYPDAGFVGEMLVIRGSSELPQGNSLPVCWEGVLGFTRINDLCVPVEGVRSKHCRFRFAEGQGLVLEPCRGKTIYVDGNCVSFGEEPVVMRHGSTLVIGEAELRLRMFAGYETPVVQRQFAAAEYEPMPRESLPQPAMDYGQYQYRQEQMQRQMELEMQLHRERQMRMEAENRLLRQQNQQLQMQRMMDRQMQQSRLFTDPTLEIIPQQQETPQPSGTIEFSHDQPFYPIEMEWDGNEEWDENPDVYFDETPDEDQTDAAATHKTGWRYPGGGAQG